MLEVLYTEWNKCKDKGTVILQGDLNARIGYKDDFITPDKYAGESKNAQPHNSSDQKSNPRGEELLDLCKFSNCLISNGRKPGDLFGEYTCHQ